MLSWLMICWYKLNKTNRVIDDWVYSCDIIIYKKKRYLENSFCSLYKTNKYDSHILWILINAWRIIWQYLIKSSICAFWFGPQQEEATATQIPYIKALINGTTVHIWDCSLYLTTKVKCFRIPYFFFLWPILISSLNAS